MSRSDWDVRWDEDRSALVMTDILDGSQSGTYPREFLEMAPISGFLLDEGERYRALLTDLVTALRGSTEAPTVDALNDWWFGRDRRPFYGPTTTFGRCYHGVYNALVAAERAVGKPLIAPSPADVPAP